MRKVFIAALLVVLSTGTAFAEPPVNDDPANAEVISSFPATVTADLSEATPGPFEQECYSRGVVVGLTPAPVKAVWYRLDLPADIEGIRISRDTDAEIVLWRRTGVLPNGAPILERRTCAYPSDNATFAYGTTYMSVGAPLSGGAWSVNVGIEVLVAPEELEVPNDAPYRATRIDAIPYEVEQDARSAGYDEDPQGCSEGAYVWYRYTPPVDQTIEVSVAARDEYMQASVALYALDDEVRTLGCDSKSDEPAIAVTAVQAGVPVLIGIGSDTLLALSVREIELTKPNDRVDATRLMFGLPVEYDSAGTTLEPGEPETCGTGGSLWFTLPDHGRTAKVVVTGGASVAAVEGDLVVACSETGALEIPVQMSASHVQVRSATGARGTITLMFDPPLGQQVTDGSPFAEGCGDVSDYAYVGSEVEVSEAVDPNDPNHILLAWQQDRYDDRGGARGVGVAVTFDGGATWARTALPGITTCSGGPHPRATDPWAAIDADGTAYVMTLGYDPGPVKVISTLNDFTHGLNTVLLSRSEDGGRDWGQPIVVAASPGVAFNDKETLTADPNTPGLLYAVWNVTPASQVLPVFARSEDGGRTWTPPTPMPNLGGGTGDQIAVLDDGTLVAVASRNSVQSVTSYDRGVTWTSPKAIAPASTGTEGPNNVRGGAYIPSVSTDGRSVYVSWSDVWSTGIARSDDAGLTWRVSYIATASAPSRSTTGVAVTEDGTIAVVTYWVEQDMDTYLLLATSTDGGDTWTERQVTDAFDMNRAPHSRGRGYFLGDYFGLEASGGDVVAAFAAVPPGDAAGISNVYVLRIAP